MFGVGVKTHYTYSCYIRSRGDDRLIKMRPPCFGAIHKTAVQIAVPKIGPSDITEG
jgi:hypothetical protein